MKPPMRHKFAQLPFDEPSQWELSEIDGQAGRLRERERTSQHETKRELSEIDGKAEEPNERE